MSEDSIYQQLRTSLAYLRLTAAAEALPGELDHAMKNKLGHSTLLARLLEVEVAAPRLGTRPVSSASAVYQHRGASRTSTSTPSRRLTEG